MSGKHCAGVDSRSRLASSCPLRFRRWAVRVLSLPAIVLIVWSAAWQPAAVATAADSDGHRSLANTRLDWPSGDQIARVVLLRDYNTRVVLLGTTMLGVCAGLVGAFMLLRKRSLVGDVVGHASLPGIGIAFIVMEMIEPGGGRSLPGLLCGAAVAGALGVAATTAIVRFTRIKEDAALAIVLSIFFGLGIALFTIIQNIPTGNAAGLNHFIFGKAASLVADDVRLIAKSAFVVLVLCVLLFKEFSLLCFDERFARAQGWPATALDLALMGLVVGVTVIGLQSVGLLLVVAMLVLPAASARFWTDRLRPLTLVSAALGGLGALLGVATSALFPRLAAGAVIVLVGTCFFVVSLLVGKQRGVVHRLLTQRRMRRRIGSQHILRAVYEQIEPRLDADHAGPESLARLTVAVDDLLPARSWTRTRLQRLLDRARRDGFVAREEPAGIRLTAEGAAAARRATRNHRLWEIYLIQYADVAPSHVDRDADRIEHILDPAQIDELEQLLSEQYPSPVVPHSPHAIGLAT